VVLFAAVAVDPAEVVGRVGFGQPSESVDLLGVAVDQHVRDGAGDAEPGGQVGVADSLGLAMSEADSRREFVQLSGYRVPT
jgi:hypothetical protein